MQRSTPLNAWHRLVPSCRVSNVEMLELYVTWVEIKKQNWNAMLAIQQRADLFEATISFQEDAFGTKCPSYRSIEGQIKGKVGMSQF